MEMTRSETGIAGKRFEMRILFKSFMIALAAGLFALPVTPADAKVKIRETTTFYTVHGRDGAALNRSMLFGGRFRIRQAHAIAATATSLDFGQPRVAVKGNYCRLENPEVILTIKYIFPKWRGRNRASKELQSSWDKFYSELVKHEEKHAAIARQGAQKLDRALKSVKVSAQNNCADFAAVVTRKLESIIEETAKRQAAFDQREYSDKSRVSRAQKLLFKAK